MNKLAFEDLPGHVYIEYLNKAQHIHDMGLKTELTLDELAKRIYSTHAEENQGNI